VLALAALLAPAIADWRVAEQLRRDRAELAAASSRVVATMAALEAREARLAAIAAFRTGRPTAVGLLETMSATLQDGSWLNGLTLEGNRVVLDGRSSDAARLVGLLGGTPPFATAAFAAPVMRDPNTGTERFRLSLELAR
jgi:general secretion pathway protein L